MTRAGRAETFLTITSLGSADPSSDDIAKVRARLAREPDGGMLAEALGLAAYDAREWRNSRSRVETSPRAKVVRREAMWGVGHD